MVKIGGRATLVRLLATVQAKHAADGVDTSSSVLEVEHPKHLEKVPYWQQGDAGMYTLDVLKVRKQLRHHPLIVNELQKWWETALRRWRES